MLAIDIQEIRQVFGANVRVVHGDALDLGSEVLGAEGPYDVVLSDMAPNTSGNKVRDQALSFELFMRAVEVSATFGKPGAAFVGKIFMSGDFQPARGRVAELYDKVQVIRPEGTRTQSSEVFVVGVGLKTR